VRRQELREYRERWAAAYAAPAAPFRFGVGARVECQVGMDEWARGAVVAHHYRAAEWPPEEWAPYQVRLRCDPYMHHYKVKGYRRSGRRTRCGSTTATSCTRPTTTTFAYGLELPARGCWLAFLW